MANPTVTPYTFVPAPTIPTPANFNTHTTDIVAVLAPELMIAQSSGTQSIATSTFTIAQMAAVNDSLGTWNGTTYLYTANWGGSYAISFEVAWTGATAGRREAYLKKVSGGVTSRIAIAPSLLPSAAGPATWEDGSTAKATDTQISAVTTRLSAGDTLQLYVWQSSGGALNLGTAGQTGARLSIVWLNN